MASGTVRDHLDNRLDLQFEDMGEKALKEVVLRIGVGDVIVEGVISMATGRCGSRRPQRWKIGTIGCGAARLIPSLRGPEKVSQTARPTAANPP